MTCRQVGHGRLASYTCRAHRMHRFLCPHGANSALSEGGGTRGMRRVQLNKVVHRDLALPLTLTDSTRAHTRLHTHTRLQPSLPPSTPLSQDHLDPMVCVA